MSDQLLAAAIVGAVFSYAAVGGVVSGVWVSIYPPTSRFDDGEGRILFSGLGWPLTLVCLTATAGYHIGKATVRMCKAFLRIPEKPS